MNIVVLEYGVKIRKSALPMVWFQISKGYNSGRVVPVGERSTVGVTGGIYCLSITYPRLNTEHTIMVKFLELHRDFKSSLEKPKNISIINNEEPNEDLNTVKPGSCHL